MSEPPNAVQITRPIFTRGTRSGKMDNVIYMNLNNHTGKRYSLDVNICNSSGEFINPHTYNIMSDVPFGQWLYISICMNNGVLDLYIDGKLVNSVNTNVLNIHSGASNVIMLGRMPAYIK